MSGIWTGSSLTTEFRHEYEAERNRWLRRRFLWYTGVVGGLNILWVVVGLVVWVSAMRAAGAWQRPDVMGVLADAGLAGVFLLALRHAIHRPLGRQAVLSLTFWLIVVSGAVRLAQGVMAIERDSVADELAASVVVGAGGAAALLPAHLFACLFLPWTPRESFRPLVPLLVLNALVSIWYAQSYWVTGAVIAASPLIGAPGALICWWRHSRFHQQFSLQMLRRRYGELKRDLVNARQIHEGLFPGPVDNGPVRLAYLYEPMRQIGGDYLYAFRSDGRDGIAALNVVLIDVTGHGIPAALTVNRLHGELERIFAEDPGSGPGEVLRLLNRYVHLTLATHSVYATAFCARIEENANTLRYASAGHPPAFLRAIYGAIDRLDSTTLVLGAVPGDDFEPAERTVPFGLGDALIAYTDGALEVRDRDGRMLGVDGLLRIIASEPPRAGRWSETILRVVDAHRSGAIADDTLIVEVWRPMEQPERKHTSASALTAGAI